MKKKNKLIPSYSFEQLRRGQTTRNVLILLEDKADIYQQVRLSEKDFEMVCKIINKGKIGFSLNVYDGKVRVEQIDDEEE